MVKITPLHGEHVKLGGRMIDFGGWEMPVQYGSILAEHAAVREAAGLFDASHMGQVLVKGENAVNALNGLLTNDIAKMRDGRAMYTLMLNENGGVLDDLLVYKLGGDEYLCVVNAGNAPRDFEWIFKINGGGVTVTNESENYALIALQGPLSAEVLHKLTDSDLNAIKPFAFIRGKITGADAIISRTGYTGEDGFELYVSPDSAVKVWNAVLSDGRVIPAGLGARDTLRLEAALPLYGHELSETITPLEAGLSRFVKLEKDGFVGKEALLAKQAKRLLTGIELTERGVPREGCRVIYGGKDAGYVTSGTHSPTLKRGVAMALLDGQYEPGTAVGIEIRDKLFSGVTVGLPFYKRKS